MRNSRSDSAHQRVKPGFTLVELLVVIGIIALLISILLPALSKARAQASSVACQANLRQIGQLIQIYTSEDKGILPFGDWNGFYNPSIPATIGVKPSPDPAAGGANWAILLMYTLQGKNGNTFTDFANTGAAGRGYLRSFQCPDVPFGGTETSGSIFGANEVPVHYTCHPRLMPVLDNNAALDLVTGKLPTSYRVSRIKRSSESALIFDGSLYSDPHAPSAGGTGTGGLWLPWSTYPVAGSLDGGRITGGPTPTTRLTDAYSLASAVGMTPNDQVDVTAYNSGTHWAGDTNLDDAHNANNIRFRHIKNNVANVLFVDGHVQSFTYNPLTKTSNFLRKYINVSY